MLVFAVDGTLLSYAVTRQDRDWFEFSIMGEECVCVFPKQRPGSLLLIWNQVTNIPKERKRNQGHSPFCYCFAMSARDCYSSFSFFYHEETARRAAALLSCFSERMLLYLIDGSAQCVSQGKGKKPDCVLCLLYSIQHTGRKFPGIWMKLVFMILPSGLYVRGAWGASLNAILGF